MALRSARGKQPLAGNPAHVVGAALTDNVEIAVKSGARRWRQGHDAFAPTLTLDGEDATIFGEHRARQCDEFRHAQASGVKGLKQRVEPQRPHAIAPMCGLRAPPRRRDQTIDLGDGERLGERPSLFGATNAQRRVLGDQSLANQELEQLPDGGEPTRPRSRRQPRLRPGAQEGTDLVRRDTCKLIAAPLKETQEIFQVAAVSLQRVGGGAALCRQHLEKLLQVPLLSVYNRHTPCRPLSWRPSAATPPPRPQAPADAHRPRAPHAAAPAGYRRAPKGWHLPDQPGPA